MKEIELVIQVANLDYARGGLRESPVFGSMRVLELYKQTTLLLQTFFIGSVTVFFIFYLIQFLSDRKNHPALFFALICLNCGMRATLWGEIPLQQIFPNAQIELGIYIHYVSGYNLMPLVMLFITAFFPADYNKKVFTVLLAVNLAADFLLLTPTGVLSMFNNWIYLLILTQCVYSLMVLIKAVLRGRTNAVLMYISISIFFLTIAFDALNYQCVGKSNISYMTLFGNFAVIIAMAVIQTIKQARANKALVLYNEKLLEADALGMRL